MPVSKPSTVPEWASGGGADITNPTLSEKQTGWTAEELPPHDYFNWWQNLVYLWILWVQDIANQAITWVGVQTYTSRIISVGMVVTPATPDGGSTYSMDLQSCNLRVGQNFVVVQDTTMQGNLRVEGTPSFDISALHTVSSEFGSGVTQPVATGLQKLIYWKLPDGTVRVQGDFDWASAASGTVLTLPSGFRPSGTVAGPGGDRNAVTTTGFASVTSAGVVTLHVSASITTGWLDLTFRPDAAHT